MKLLPLTRKKPVTTKDVSHPQPLPEVQVTRADSADTERASTRRKRQALAVQDEDARELSRSIREGSTQSTDTSPLPSLRMPHNASVVSFASSLSLRERRSSSRSLELLRAAEEEGRLPAWHNLPPSPDAVNLTLIRRFSQWGEEAGSEAEKAQRVRLVRSFVQVAQNGLPYLTIDDADLVVDLPDALGELTSLRALTLRNLRRMTRVPDLRSMAFLQHVEVEACPMLRLPAMARQQVVVDGVEQNPLHRGTHSQPAEAARTTQAARKPMALGRATGLDRSGRNLQVAQATAPRRAKPNLLGRLLGARADTGHKEPS